MRRALPLVCGVLIALLPSCDDQPSGPEREAGGVYAGSWSIQVTNQSTGEFVEGICSGSMSLLLEQEDVVSGEYVLRDDGDCAFGSPVSGAITEGDYRHSDGGVSFKVGAPGSNSNIFTDVIPGAFSSGLLRGSCEFTSADDTMIGAIQDANLEVSADAGVECNYETENEEGETEQVTEFVVIQLVFDGSR